ncbi:hypothetical protein RFI_09320, partial [Reticulomyxa filosa]
MSHQEVDIDTEEVDACPLFTSSQKLEEEQTLKKTKCVLTIGRVLLAMTQPNNENLKRATLLLGSFMEDQKSVLCLMQQLDQSSNAEVRQVAAVYLREQIESFWKKIPTDLKEKLKKFLIEKLFGAKEKAERLAIASVTTTAARLIFVKEQWTELLQALEKASAKPAPVDLREVWWCVIVLYLYIYIFYYHYYYYYYCILYCIVLFHFLQFCGGSLKKHFNKILPILNKGLEDEESQKIQVESLKAIGAMVEFLEDQREVQILESVIPQMVAVIDKCLKKGDEQNVCEGIGVFIELVESKVPVLKKHGVRLTQFMLKIAAAK